MSIALVTHGRLVPVDQVITISQQFIDISADIEGVVNVNIGSDCRIDCDGRISVFSGRDIVIKITLTTSIPLPETPIVLTGSKAWFSVKEDIKETDENALISKSNALAGGSSGEIYITDAENGILEIYINRNDTIDLEDGDYWYDVVIENSSGNRVQAISPSKFHIKRVVTKVVDSV